MHRWENAKAGICQGPQFVSLLFERVPQGALDVFDSFDPAKVFIHHNRSDSRARFVLSDDCKDAVEGQCSLWLSRRHLRTPFFVS